MFGVMGRDHGGRDHGGRAGGSTGAEPDTRQFGQAGSDGPDRPPSQAGRRRRGPGWRPVVPGGEGYESLLVDQPDQGIALVTLNRPDTLDSLTFTMVDELPIGVRLTKQLISANVDAPSLASALEIENRSQVLTAQSEDMREALDAFRSKRPPTFHHR